ncbi:hypothetical protein C8R45DRAFT_924171 [Mycena sanguinolenta]|nr:hypothetical protein C8R45DRAFT_924171 [Mycena sanguinolenta]
MSPFICKMDAPDRSGGVGEERDGCNLFEARQSSAKAASHNPWQNPSTDKACIYKRTARGTKYERIFYTSLSSARLASTVDHPPILCNCAPSRTPRPSRVAPHTSARAWTLRLAVQGQMGPQTRGAKEGADAGARGKAKLAGRSRPSDIKSSPFAMQQDAAAASVGEDPRKSLAHRHSATQNPGLGWSHETEQYAEDYWWVDLEVGFVSEANLYESLRDQLETNFKVRNNFAKADVAGQHVMPVISSAKYLVVCDSLKPQLYSPVAVKNKPYFTIHDKDDARALATSHRSLGVLGVTGLHLSTISGVGSTDTLPVWKDYMQLHRIQDVFSKSSKCPMCTSPCQLRSTRLCLSVNVDRHGLLACLFRGNGRTTENYSATTGQLRRTTENYRVGRELRNFGQTTEYYVDGTLHYSYYSNYSCYRQLRREREVPPFVPADARAAH